MEGIYEIKNLKRDNYSLLHNETLFHNANGYIGIRSVFEEGYPDGYASIRGQYINGFYDFTPMKQAEKLYGLPEEKQTMLNVADTQTIRLYLDEEAFSIFEGTILSSRRWVDMDKGVTGREIKWRSPLGKEVLIRIIRMTSFQFLTSFTIDYTVIPLNFDGEITFESIHDGNVRNFYDPTDPRVADEDHVYLEPLICEIKRAATYITSRTTKSRLEVCSAVKNIIKREHEREFVMEKNKALCRLTLTAEKNENIRLIKYATFCDSIRYNNCREEAALQLQKVTDMPIESLYELQEQYLKEFWENCHMKIVGDDELNIAIRYNLYQLIQSSGKDKYSNVPPKGLSGEGYEGHYFWDSEMYVQPFFTVTNPEVSKSLIEYRYGILDKAKEHARIMGHKKGALYPWRTIMGDECSGYFPAGSAQYHINGDIAYSIVSYYLATKDVKFIADKGAEIIFETARLWMDVGNYQDGTFHINNVTGPDEYTCLVNNNYYTNSIAKYNLNWAVKFHELLKRMGRIDTLMAKIELTEQEISEFKKAAANMFMPYDEKLGINPQDDSFLQKKDWDLESIPKHNFPLLLHYHPLHLYRHKICKQPDVIMAHFILEDEQTEEVMMKSYEYYERITTHDSSLSNCVFSIMASKLGMVDKAYKYFGYSAEMDLLDKHRNTKDGLHIANMGGNYLVIVYGFAGLRLKEKGIYFSPIIPKKWKSYSFKITYEDSRIQIEVDQETIRLTLENGLPKKVYVYDKEVELNEEAAYEVSSHHI